MKRIEQHERAALVSKLDAEAASGQYGADILMAGMTELLSTVAKDRAQSFRPPNLGALPPRYIDPQGRFVIQFADVFGVVYNTQKMTEADLPKSIKDLTDPKGSARGGAIFETRDKTCTCSPC